MVHSLNTFFLGVVCILDSEIRERTPELAAPNNLTSIFLTIEIKKGKRATKRECQQKFRRCSAVSKKRTRKIPLFGRKVQKSLRSVCSLFVSKFVIKTHFCFVAEYRGQVR